MDTRTQTAILKAARTAARHEVEGFLAHDMHDYDGAKLNFYKSLRLILTKYPDATLKRIAQEKTDVLRHHDRIEESDSTKREKLESPLWSQALKHARKEAELLGIDDSYAFHKVEFYRLHGQGIARFRDHVYRMDRIFTEGLTGDPNLYHVTAPLYLACIAFHDLRRRNGSESHDEFAKEMMTRYYADYVFNLLQAMNDRQIDKPFKKSLSVD